MSNSVEAGPHRDLVAYDVLRKCSCERRRDRARKQQETILSLMKSSLGLMCGGRALGHNPCVGLSTLLARSQLYVPVSIFPKF